MSSSSSDDDDPKVSSVNTMSGWWSDDDDAQKLVVIDKFPQPYTEKAVVQQQTSFSAETRDAIALGKVPLLRLLYTLVLGDAKVGKTALISRYSRNVFPTYDIPTGEEEVAHVDYSILGQAFTTAIFDGYSLNVLWTMMERKGSAGLVVFDLSDIKSLEGTRSWFDKIPKDVFFAGPLFLVGTKKDRCEPAELEEVETRAVTLAKEFGAEYWSVSSKTGYSTDGAEFQQAVTSMPFY